MAENTAAQTRVGGPCSTPTDRELAVVVRGLCLTQIVSWGVLYYTFPVLLTSIAKDTGWSMTSLTATFSGTLLIAGLAGIPAGRLLDKVGPRTVMSSASTLATAAVLLVALAPTRGVFTAGWAVVGVAMAGALYAPAFAAITVWSGERRVPALTKVTLVGGLASTVFAPLTAALNDHLGWRGTFVLLAAVLGVLTIPTHLAVLRPTWPAPMPHQVGTTGGVDADRWPSRLMLLSGAFAVCALGSLAVLTNLVVLLQERGFTVSDAALVLGTGGVGQVAGRLGYERLHETLGVRTRTFVVLVAVAAGTAALALTPGPLALLVAVALVVGNARGIFTLLQATAVSDRWGTEHYPRLNGIFGAPPMLAGAAAPFVGSGLAVALGGYTAALFFLALAGLGAAVLTLAVPAQRQDMALATLSCPTSAAD